MDPLVSRNGDSWEVRMAADARGSRWCLKVQNPGTTQARVVMPATMFYTQGDAEQIAVCMAKAVALMTVATDLAVHSSDACSLCGQ